MVDALESYQPEAIATYPSVAGQIALEQIQGRLRIAPRTVAVGSEVLTEDVERAVETAWGIKPLNVYAATEAPLIAAACPDQAGLHISEDLLIVESVDERGEPVPPGSPGNKVLLTNLVNYTQPLIRYELSDSIVLASERDIGGWPYARIERVDGRSDDILQMRDGVGRPVAIHPYRLRVPFVALSEVRRYQMLFDGETLTVRLVLDPSAPRDTPERVGAAITNAIEGTGAVAPTLLVTPVDSIEREPGHAAKFKLVKLVAR
jgi:phenylacetate-coenzyme A ligase PaaK-like adenylate-forming protein